MDPDEAAAFEHAEIAATADSVSIRFPRCELRESLNPEPPVCADWRADPFA